MITPISSGTVPYTQSTPTTKPQTLSAASSQSSGSASTEDSVELSSQAKSALSGGNAISEAQQYSKPLTLQANSSRGGAASH